MIIEQWMNSRTSTWRLHQLHQSLTTFFLLKAKSSDLVFEDIDDDLDQELGHLTLGMVDLYSRTSMCDHLS